MAMQPELLKAQVFRRLVTKGFKFIPGYPSIKDVADIIIDETIRHIQATANVVGTATGQTTGATTTAPPVPVVTTITAATITGKVL